MDAQTVMHEALVECREKAGSLSQLARDLGVPQPTMWRWFHQAQRLPAEYVPKAEELYGVSRYKLRPDVYAEPPRRQRKKVAA